MTRLSATFARRDGFVRCYFEAWVYWLALNLVGVGIEWITSQVRGESFNALSVSRLGQFTDPVMIVAQGVILIPLFTALLLGSRRRVNRNP